MEAYPPQQGYYPPQQAGYYPGYPPQPGYPAAYPQQQAYPQQAAYPQEPGKTAVDAPPPYFGTAAPPSAQVQHVPQHHATSNVVVVNSQPTPVITHAVIRPTGDHYLTLSIVLTAICLFCGTWYSLLCTIPAIIIAISARDAEARGDIEGARSKGRIALILNIVAMIWWVIALVILIAAVAGSIASSSSCYSYYYGYYDSYYRTYRYTYGCSRY